MTFLVLRHAPSAGPVPILPAQLAGHRVLCRSCTDLASLRRCLRQPQAISADWVVLDLAVADEAQWQHEAAALGDAIEHLPAPFIELQSPAQPGLETRLRLQHGPAAIVADQRSQQSGYPLSLAIVGRRLAMEG